MSALPFVTFSTSFHAFFYFLFETNDALRNLLLLRRLAPVALLNNCFIIQICFVIYFFFCTLCGIINFVCRATLTAVWTPPSPSLAEYWLREREWMSERASDWERGANSGVDVAFSSMRIFTKQHVMAHTTIGVQWARERERQCKSVLRER